MLESPASVGLFASLNTWLDCFSDMAPANGKFGSELAAHDRLVLADSSRSPSCILTGWY